MGGYGSLKLGLKHPDRFASIYADSSKVDWRNSRLELSLLAPPQDVVGLDSKPAISFACGTEDELLQENRWLHSELDKLSLEHDYVEFDGGHDWDYWDLHVQEALEQHAEILRLADAVRA